MPRPVTISVTEVTFEKLDPPTTVAGLRAEIAEVTRVYDRNFDDPTDQVLVGEPRVSVQWGKTVADVKADLSAAIAKAQVDLDARTEEIVKQQAALDAKPAG